MNKITFPLITFLFAACGVSFAEDGFVLEKIAPIVQKKSPAIIITGTNVQWNAEKGFLEIKEQAGIEYTYKIKDVNNPAIMSERKAIIISKGSGTINSITGTAVFRKDVEVKDAETNLKAHTIKIYMEPKTKKLAKFEAYGKVEIKQIDKTSFSKKAIYYAQEDKMVLTGNPIIFSENDSYTADVINIYEQGKRVVFEPKATLVIYNKSENAEI